MHKFIFYSFGVLALITSAESFAQFTNDAEIFYSIQDTYKFDFYSQTIYDSRFSGSTNETRARYIYDTYKMKPYLALNFSRDLTYGKAPILTLNAWSPALGLQYKLTKNIGLLGEVRRLYTDQIPEEREIRYGAYLNIFKILKHSVFQEIYSEAFAIDYVDSTPYLMLSSKLGRRWKMIQNLNYDLYLEGFTKQSPNLGYGPTENEARIGNRLSYYSSKLSFILDANYSPLSNVKTDGVDFMLSLSGVF
jgi:hypothetical protein